MKVRPANDDHDMAVIHGLYNDFFPAPFPKASSLLMLHGVRVAELPEGKVVGFRAVSPVGFVWVAVIADYQRRGIGSLLLNDALEYASESGMTELNSRVNDAHVGGRAFCEQFEFKPYLHMVNLELDLMNWNTSAHYEETAPGIAFKTYADYEDSDANRQRLYVLNKALSATVPRAEPQPFMDFNTYIQRQLTRETCPHNGIYLAVNCDQWIGMSQISLHEGYAFVEMTGVLPEYRGQGIAQALKRLTVQFVQQNNRRIIKTFNDVSNAPMIAVNEKSGFRRGNGFYFMRRTLV